LVVDGDKRARLDYDSQFPSAATGAYAPKAEVEIFDDGVIKTFQPYAPGMEYPSGSIYHRGPEGIVRNVRFLPLSMVCRPFNKPIGLYDPEKFVLTGKTGIADEHTCLIMNYQDQTIWVDPAREFVPTRLFMSNRGITTMSFEIKYSRDPQVGWVPSAWTWAYLTPKGEVRESINCKVGHYDINRPISIDTFSVQYTPGTWVEDLINKETYIVRETDKRPVLPREFDGKTYEELLNSDPPRKPGLTILVIINVAILIAIIGVAVCYRRLKKTRSATSKVES
jgi:hypothetical protein